MLEFSEWSTKLIADGADFLKICTGGGVIGRAADAAATEMPQEFIAAIVDEANRQKRRVAAHAQGPAAIRAAANAGVDSIEHGGLIDDDTARLLAEKRIAPHASSDSRDAPATSPRATRRISSPSARWCRWR
ncbi:MAG TPA: amidohydrolase family protein [Thermoanaerobaculia bacterium]|nr:amidohydrolase family protein [Thermoanaerobaculia bacterium]